MKKKNNIVKCIPNYLLSHAFCRCRYIEFLKIGERKNYKSNFFFYKNHFIHMPFLKTYTTPTIKIHFHSKSIIKIWPFASNRFIRLIYAKSKKFSIFILHLVFQLFTMPCTPYPYISAFRFPRITNKTQSLFISGPTVWI